MFVFFEPVGEYYAHVVFVYVHIISPMEYYVLSIETAILGEFQYLVI